MGLLCFQTKVILKWKGMLEIHMTFRLTMQIKAGYHFYTQLSLAPILRQASVIRVHYVLYFVGLHCPVRGLCRKYKYKNLLLSIFNIFIRLIYQ